MESPWGPGPLSLQPGEPWGGVGRGFPVPGSAGRRGCALGTPHWSTQAALLCPYRRAWSASTDEVALVGRVCFLSPQRLPLLLHC